VDFGANKWRVADHLAPLVGEILTQMGCTNVTTSSVPELSLHTDWWAAHMRGGARTGENSATSVFNKWLQCWDVENLFAAGEITFPFGDNITPGTHPVGMQAYLAADGIKQYLENPGPLV
jgi:gluconate 2-dehydrogenase alpha chain